VRLERRRDVTVNPLRFATILLVVHGKTEADGDRDKRNIAHFAHDLCSREEPGIPAWLRVE
jgi:hypothetical protein